MGARRPRSRAETEKDFEEMVGVLCTGDSITGSPLGHRSTGFTKTGEMDDQQTLFLGKGKIWPSPTAQASQPIHSAPTTGGGTHIGKVQDPAPGMGL